MARLKLLADYNNLPAGAVIELPGGVASVLILRGIAEFDPEPAGENVVAVAGAETQAQTSPDTAEATTIVVPRADGEVQAEAGSEAESSKESAAKTEAAPTPPSKPEAPKPARAARAPAASKTQPKPKAAKATVPTKPKPAPAKGGKAKRK